MYFIVYGIENSAHWRVFALVAFRDKGKQVKICIEHNGQAPLKVKIHYLMLKILHRGDIMEIPKKVKIGPHWFDIEITEVVNKFIPRKGEINLVENTIKIDKSMAQSKQEETFFHEALHEISAAVAVELDEGDVTRLAYGFYMFLVDNELLKQEGEDN